MDDMPISKISFLGDIMCERPFLNAAKNNNGFNFNGFLEPCRSLFAKSHLVIGNLETPCDPDSPFTKNMFIFNAPPSFVSAIKDSGIDFVTTATNHCLDRGLAGLKRTIKTLDQIGLKHTGTFLNKEQPRFEIISLPNGARVAVLSYTYGTNYYDNREVIEPNDYSSINYLTPLFEGRNKGPAGQSLSLRACAARLIPREFRIRMNLFLGRATNAAYMDQVQEGDLNEEIKKGIAETIRKARELADIVVMCPHFGGQFNIKPGTYVDTFVNLFDSLGVNLVVGNHPHVVQNFALLKSGMQVAYSLGNVSMSLSTPYILTKDLPECSVMLHAYVSNKKIYKLGFSVLIETENSNGFITVYPLYKLYEKSTGRLKELLEEKNLTIYNRFLGTNVRNIPMQEEYEIDCLF